MFRENIKKMVEALDGGVGGVLMGFDGIAVDSYSREAGRNGGHVPDIQTIGMEFAHLISQMRRGAQSLELGFLREMTIRTERLTVIMHVLNNDYFVACAFLSPGNVGKARYLLRMTAPRLEAEL
jgi:predicted regulator of Ras-like GTPase activity (Roadblock/LC7/MglB family)